MASKKPSVRPSTPSPVPIDDAQQLLDECNSLISDLGGARMQFPGFCYWIICRQPKGGPAPEETRKLCMATEPVAFYYTGVRQEPNSPQIDAVAGLLKIYDDHRQDHAYRLYELLAARACSLVKHFDPLLNRLNYQPQHYAQMWPIFAYMELKDGHPSLFERKMILTSAKSKKDAKAVQHYWRSINEQLPRGEKRAVPHEWVCEVGMDFWSISIKAVQAIKAKLSPYVDGNDEPFFPAGHFNDKYGIPASRLRKAWERHVIRTRMVGRRRHYSFEDAKRLWPQDIVDQA